MRLIVSFLLSVLSGMGVGGGGLLVIYLSLYERIGQHTAQGINLIFFLAASLSALIVNLKRRRLCPTRLLITAFFGAISACFGAILASKAEVTLLRRLFGGLLILSGAISFFRREKA